MFNKNKFREFEPVKMKSFKSKKVILCIAIFLFVMALGFSYSFFVYNKDGSSHQLIAGNIYFKSTNDGNVSLTGLYPMSDSIGLLKGVKYKFDVVGYNLSNKAIHYGIYVNEGDEIKGKTRLCDSDIKLSLTKTVAGVTTTVLGPFNVNEFNRNILYTDTILGNISKENQVDIAYELTMWIDEKVLISDSVNEIPGRSIYTTEEFKNSYASIKLEVYGDFKEK